MKTKIAQVLIVIFMFSSEGCAMNLNSDKENNYNSQEKNFVSEEQAFTLVKKYLVSKGINLYNLKKMRLIDEKDYDYSLFTQEEFEKKWIIIIPTKRKVQISQGLKWGIVYVDKRTGEVKPCGMGPS